MIKTIKKTVFLSIVLMLVFVVTGCTLNREAITPQDFTAKAESLGFIVQDVTHQMGGQTVRSLIAIDVASIFQVEFHQVSTRVQASAAFIENQNNLTGIGTGTTSSRSGANWARFSTTSGGAYGFVSYIENTFVFARVPREHRDAVRKLVDLLGY